MRRTKVVTIAEPNRDKGKSYLLTEMPAARGARWASHLFLTLLNGGVAIPDNLVQMGMAGIAAMDFRTLLRLTKEDIDPLLDELMMCVSVKPPTGEPRPIMQDEDIEEISTIFALQLEVFALHTGFSLAAARPTSGSASAEGSRSSTTSTSTKPSAP